MSSSELDPKVAKKMAKAAAKAAKKRVAGGLPPEPKTVSPPAGSSPAERAAAAAERQVALHRWRVVLAAVAALIGLVTLLVTTCR
jgi:hypothetical protein